MNKWDPLINISYFYMVILNDSTNEIATLFSIQNITILQQ